MSTHENTQRGEHSSLPSDRSFGGVWVVVLLIVGLWPYVSGRPPRIWLIALAAPLLVITLLWPRLLRPLNRLWYRLGLLLGRVVTPIVCAVLFYGVFVPMGLLMRIFRKDPLGLKWDSEARSYWKTRSDGDLPPESMTRQF